MANSIPNSIQGNERAASASAVLSVVQLIGIFVFLFCRSWNPHLFWSLILVWGAAAVAKLVIHETYNLFPKHRSWELCAASFGVIVFITALLRLAKL